VCQEVVAFVGAGADHHQPGRGPPTRVAREALRTGRPTVGRSAQEVGCSTEGCPLRTAVVAPLRTRDRVVGALEVCYPAQEPLSAARVRAVTELARLMSLQIELAELDRKTEQLARAQLAALQAQISPHFVYNTLNTIASFIRTQPDEARRLLSEFADFTRRSFKRTEEFAPFAQELEYVHQYLGFEKARFGDRLNVIYRVDPEVLSTVVPVLLLQPLVENAVRHGLAHKEGPVKVLIRAEDRGNECWITVQDDGSGIPLGVIDRLLGTDGQTQAPSETLVDRPRQSHATRTTTATTRGLGLGMTSVHERLRSVYGPEYGLSIHSEPGEGTRVSFAVPKFKAGVGA
jgi:LytS/YehU family sensor histidine kinase